LATCSSEAKRAIAQTAGAAEVFAYDGFTQRVDELTAGRGVAAVFDGVGQTTFLDGLACLAPRGTMVLFGAASGPVAPFDPMLLARKSLFLTRPTLWSYIATPADLLARATAVMAAAVRDPELWRPGCVAPLQDAGRAHALLRGRQLTGKIVLQVLPA
jgi:NADPH2:quinone reductase